MAEWRSNKIKRRMQYLIDIGLNPDDVDAWGDKWATKRKNAKRYNIVFTLPFDKYVSKAKDAGIKSPDLIGRHIGDFALGRLGDVGGYTEDNCRFILVEQNLQELEENGGRQKIADTQRGRSKETHQYLANLSAIRKTHTAETQEWVRIRAEKIRGRTSSDDKGVANATIKQSSYFRVIDPNGNVYIGHNICKFCRDNSQLNPPTQSNLSAVCRGSKSVCKGWTGSYISQDEYNSYSGPKQSAVDFKETL